MRRLRYGDALIQAVYSSSNTDLSAKGVVVWIIEARIYLAWKEWFDSIELDEIQPGNINPYYDLDEDQQVVSIQFTDSADQPEDLMRVLLKIGATLPKPATVMLKGTLLILLK